jgi:nucleoside-diphosphate-sugar epimerase
MTKSKKELGFTPRFDIEKGIAQYMKVLQA